MTSWVWSGALALVASVGAAVAAEPHNIVLFVPDGLRAAIVTPETAPTMAELRDRGVGFANSHSMFPTLTMPNASAMATGHYLGDTGTFGNTLYTAFPVPGAGDSLTPFIESDPVLGDVDEHFGGNYLDEETLLHAARRAGFNTAAIGKLGPTLLFAHTERNGNDTVIVDDATGSNAGIPLVSWLSQALTSATLPLAAPPRGENAKAGNATTPGTKSANIDQQTFFVNVLTKAVLPKFKGDQKPFLVVFWSRDPDGTQHNQGDSPLSLTPGINGPTSLAAIRNADDNLAAIRHALSDLGLADTTDVIVSADHGFSTISKQSATSAAAKARYNDVPAGLLPPGFVALDLAAALGLPLWDPDLHGAAVAPGTHSRLSNGLIGADPHSPALVVAANGGADLIYFTRPDYELTRKVVETLLTQDYVSGLFVDDALGSFPGTLPLSTVNLNGSAITPMPAIVVNFKSVSTGCGEPQLCTAEIADTGLQQGQGMHGSFSRADTHNFMAATGPDFKQRFVDDAPVSNADVGKTIAALMHLDVWPRGRLLGREITEAMVNGGDAPRAFRLMMMSEPTASGLRTMLRYQQLGTTKYFDAAGFEGRTVGLEPSDANSGNTK